MTQDKKMQITTIRVVLVQQLSFHVDEAMNVSERMARKKGFFTLALYKYNVKLYNKSKFEICDFCR
mgnify:FL=1